MCRPEIHLPVSFCRALCLLHTDDLQTMSVMLRLMVLPGARRKAVDGQVGSRCRVSIMRADGGTRVDARRRVFERVECGEVSFWQTGAPSDCLGPKIADRGWRERAQAHSYMYLHVLCTGDRLVSALDVSPHSKTWWASPNMYDRPEMSVP